MSRRICAARRIWAGLLALAALAVTQSCAESPTRPSCSYRLSPATQSVAGSGGIFQVTMTTAEACQWSATVDASWVTLETPRGTGPGPVVFHVAANPGDAMRAAAISVQGQGIEIRQEALTCAVDVSPESIAFGPAGGMAPLAVTAPGGCRWAATTGDAWLSLAGAAGEGNGPMIVSAAPNPGVDARTGALRVGGQTVSVTQAGVGCDFDVTPTSRAIGAAGGSFTVAVETASSCEWRADPHDRWLTVSASRGTGAGQVTVDVAAQTATSSRTGTLRIGGHTVTVTQAGATAPTPCTFALSAHAQPVPAAGGAFSVNVTTTAQCAWAASSSAPWVSVSAGQSGSGPGLVGYDVAANTSASARTATLQIADQTLTITQTGTPAPCSYTVSPLTQSVPASGGSFQFTVTTSANCQWTATPADAWVAITPTSGSGSTTVSYSVGPNPTTAARTSSIQVAGQTLSISQAAASCSFALDTTSQAVPAGGGNYRVTVKTMAGCGWTASSNAGWLVVTAGSKGSGPGTVSYTVRGNTSQVPRVGTLTIGNQTVTVTQAGAGTIP